MGHVFGVYQVFTLTPSWRCMACATGGGGCHGTWEAGAVPADPAGLHSFAGHELCAPLALASGASQQSPPQVLLIKP
jgi:hypothetical protein